MAALLGVVLLMWVASMPMFVAVGHGAQATPLTITAGPLQTGDNVEAYDAAVQYVVAQLQAAIASSAELKAVPSNLSPSLADAAAELPAMMFDGCLRAAFPSRTT